MARLLAEQQRLLTEQQAMQQQLRHYQDMQAAQQARMFTGSAVWFNEARGTGVYEWARNEAAVTLQGFYPPTETQEQAEKKRAALTRALGLLEEKIGPDALAKIQAGGAYTVRSKWWPNVVYLVPKQPQERVRVLADGATVTESCLVTTDPSLPWPDVLLQRITALEMDESILFETGVLHDFAKGPARRLVNRLRTYFRAPNR